MSDERFETIVDTTSALLKSTFAQLGMHDAPLVHYAKRIKDQEKLAKKNDARKSVGPSTAAAPGPDALAAPSAAVAGTLGQPQIDTRGGQVSIYNFFAPVSSVKTA